MKNNTKTPVIDLLSELKRKMRKGDRIKVAKQVGCHPGTLDDALEGEVGEKRDQALAALISIIEKREEENRSRLERIQNKN